MYLRIAQPSRWALSFLWLRFFSESSLNVINLLKQRVPGVLHPIPNQKKPILPLRAEIGFALGSLGLDGLVIAEYDQHRNLTEYVYDLAGRREQVIRHIDGQTQTHSFTYYPNGELHTETDANGHTTTYVFLSN